MIRFSLNNGSDEIWIDSNEPNERNAIRCKGNNAARIENWLYRQYNPLGHLIGDVTSPIDLHYALTRPEAQQFNPKLIEGESLVKSYDFKLPNDAVS